MTALRDLHAGPAAGFDEPFEMLDACHRRVERSLNLLERVLVHVATHGADAQAQQAARDVLRYFDTAAPLHHEDEERHVLPLLRTQGQAALAERILGEHQAMTLAWAGLRAVLHDVSEGRWRAAPEAIAAEARAFVVLYREHIALEEREVFPRARAGAAAPALQAMGSEMAQRRGAR